MKRLNTSIIIIVTVLSCAFAACHGSREARMAEIASAEDSLRKEGMMIINDSEAADRMIALYIDFADKFPADTMSPKYLFRAADVALSQGDTEKGLALLERIISDYDDFRDLPMCYVTKATTLENEERYDDARTAYEEYLRLFPDHFMAEDVKRMLPFVGISPEEMLDSILANADQALLK